MPGRAPVPMQIRRMRLQRAGAGDAAWPSGLFGRIGAATTAAPDGTLTLA